MVTDLGGAQISSLLETLPGIAQVLRSPVADAFVKLIRQAARHVDFQVADAEEVLRFAVRRNLMNQDESDRLLGEVREGIQKRADRAADRAEARKPVVVQAPVKAATPKPVFKAKPVPPKAPPVKAAKLSKPVKAAKPSRPSKPVKVAKPVKKAKPAKPAAKKKAPARKR